MNRLGSVIGVGVGPGDPELLTIKAYRALKEADVIAYPKKRQGAKSYAHQIVEPFLPEETRKLGLVFPMTKDQSILEREWKKITDTIYSEVEAGHKVAFVTEGDPMLYSTFIHLLNTMRAEYPQVTITSIPGISSIHAMASQVMVPLADGDEWTAVIPANDNREKMKEALRKHDGMVFIKVAKVLPMMIEILEEMNLIDQAFVATKVTSSEEYIWKDIRELRTAELEYLTLMMVRKEKVVAG
ncbi:precorrin-2 C(20)-methyltransferase [Thalassorhabdus alkalitolerans]|uniref:Precorrin-2 C(20)-methyltransferase n=1 Tax=Thalassorhabdus alkalitolerans TaxID=2282697 RepID=A0ABW0YP53_9BACI